MSKPVAPHPLYFIGKPTKASMVSFKRAEMTYGNAVSFSHIPDSLDFSSKQYSSLKGKLPDIPFSEAQLGKAIAHATLWLKVAKENRAATICAPQCVFAKNFFRQQERLLAKINGWHAIHWALSGENCLSFQVPKIGKFFTSSVENEGGTHLSLGRVSSKAMPFSSTITIFLGLVLSRSHLLYKVVQAGGLACYSISPEGARYYLQKISSLKIGEITDYKRNKPVLVNDFERLMSVTPLQTKSFVCIAPIAWLRHKNKKDTADGSCLSADATQFGIKRSADLTSWRFFTLKKEGAPKRDIPYLSLLPDGHIGGSHFFSGWKWKRSEYGKLAFISPSRGRKIVFLPEKSENGENIFYTNTEGYQLLPINYEAFSPISDNDPSLVKTEVPPEHRKIHKNLVIVRCGNNSLHSSWFKNVTHMQRNWDLLISFYGSRDNFSEIDECEYKIFQKGPKFRPLYELFVKNGSLLQDYEYFSFIDDDILIGGDDINRCFSYMREFNLAIAQPSLRADTPKEKYSWSQLRQVKGSRLRFTDFVEVMMPFLSRDALIECLPTFILSETGMGLDFVWPAILGYPHRKIAIIDDVTAQHTRDVGGGSAYSTPKYDMARMRKLFGIFDKVELNGGNNEFNIYGQLHDRN